MNQHQLTLNYVLTHGSWHFHSLFHMLMRNAFLLGHMDHLFLHQGLKHNQHKIKNGRGFENRFVLGSNSLYL